MGYVINAVTAILETMIAIFCYNAILDKRDMKKTTRGGMVVLFALFNIIRSYFNIGDTLNLAVSIVSVMILAFVLYRDKWYKNLFAAAVYILIFIVSEIIAQYITAFAFNISYGSAISEGRLTVSLITDFIAFMIALYFINIPAKKIVDIPLKYWLVIILMPIFSLALLIILDVTVRSDNQFYALWSVIIVVGLIYCNVMLYSFFENYSDRLKLKIAEQVIKNNRENYKILETNEKDMSVLRHDFLKHISTIRELAKNGENEAAAEYADRLEKSVKSAASVVYTGNAAMDSILNIEGRLAQINDIEYFVKPVISADIKLSDMDITAILRNALDNAIEAQKQIENRCIVVNIYADEEKVKIEIINYSDDVVIKEGKTSKSDKANHGFGLKSIRSTVQKYNGELDYTYRNGIFTLSVLLDNKKM